MKKVAILQSNYIPWKGYFDIIGSVDEFIIYDEVQFTKNDWRNRNKIKTKDGVQWITIPVRQKKLSQKISETEVSDLKWRAKHWSTIITNYSKAPNFKAYADQFEDFYTNFNSILLSEINVTLVKLICGMLSLNTKITSSIEFNISGDPTERLVNICKQAHAQVYISGPAAKHYLKEDLFRVENITVDWINHDNYPSYRQLHPPFDHHVSIIDLLFNEGTAATQFMKYGKKGIRIF